MTIPTVPISMEFNKNSNRYGLQNVTGLAKNFFDFQYSTLASVCYTVIIWLGCG